ncbi:MAG: FimV/HubP family polar landmark protein, partial [Pseudomonadota bacterium]
MIQRLLRVALIGALLPATSWALGVGEIQVRSKLNEPLRAEIELIYSDTSEAEGAAVQLASVEDFERVGLDPSLAGNELMFNVVRNDQGNFVIEVTSLAPVVETFLDFLIEVQWENGRLLREYVILLDPPVTAPSPVQVAPLPSSEPPAPIARPTTTPSTTPRTTRPTRSTGGSDYTVARGDTLWEIARDYRPDDSITINQMMVAILRMNPDAFYENNVNALREGAILRIPDSAESAAISLGAANSTVQEHNELFNIYVRSQTGGAVPTISDAGADAEYDSASGRTAPSEADSRLELVPPGNDTRSVADRPGAGEEAQRMREELARVREDLISARQENTELQDRVGELEELVGSMERAISLKDADLADLESQLRAARETEADLTAGTTPAPVTEAPATSPIVEPEPTVPATTDQPIAEEPADQVPAGAAPPQPRPTTEPVTFDEEPGLLSNPLILGGGALVLLG